MGPVGPRSPGLSPRDGQSSPALPCSCDFQAERRRVEGKSPADLRCSRGETAVLQRSHGHCRPGQIEPFPGNMKLPRPNPSLCERIERDRVDVEKAPHEVSEARVKELIKIIGKRD
ncbi:hypothetical protein DUI87_04018 [Hirundo rustica rustica]|uniref:Uncharacterized protein n=1 Tax=Hirundo rustica rustica TaxID=333673 RepID=A0A3M0L1S2_HIRRU|nr:hypothetical protein DUI87_04018 [Hirundo rustica rustica]